MIVTQMIFVLNDRLREASMMLNQSTRPLEVTRFDQFSISQKFFLTSTFVYSVFFVAALFELWVMHSLLTGERLVRPVVRERMRHDASGQETRSDETVRNSWWDDYFPSHCWISLAP